MNYLDINHNFLALEDEYSNPEKSDIFILSAPLEKTVSYGRGTAEGPKAILDASHYVEFFDEETGREICFEKGICALEPLKLNNMSVEKGIEKIYMSSMQILENEKFLVTLGGEHSLTLAPFRAYNEKFDNLSILQIDAHSDLRDSYDDSKYSHASVMARIAEFTDNIVQVGIRAQCREEYDFIQKNGISTYYARFIRNGDYGVNWEGRVVDNLTENVYITFDIDGFDPSVVPATGTPEPGGLFWDETLGLLKRVGRERNIVGFDIVELAPSKYHSASNFIAAKLLYKMLNFAFINEVNKGE